MEAEARGAPAEAADDQVTEVVTKFRTLEGPARTAERLLLLALTMVGAFWATQVHHYLPFAFFNEQYLGLFLGLGLGAVFIVVKERRRRKR